MIPKHLHKYFWEINPRELSLSEDADYIVARLLDYGKTQDIEWLLERFGKDRIKTVLKKYRGISRKSAYFWSNILQINPREVKCLQTLYHRIPFGV
ncbi:hypothetical protein AUK18_00575 [Candidatus Beckwithbacteria bacterium CG2_30_44_31]|uniref:DUF6922 domain-containing protein n=1 Tax=Candidatus Beckwithbacteria bacterium CG2_30_44_31 TaxID=1805035 RepID=A0A1J5AYK8_9BACT|nr:MAG: hypothetical protein AUK18_00575 [Candidatus Beckwithbacteria bacterium CG2_30_44_31]